MLLLRLTIPVDIYSSPILVEVNGVECQLCVKSKLSNTSSAARTNHDRICKRPRSRNNVGGKTSKARRSSESLDEDDVDPAIPSATDLAASFLQTEPQEERAELEAAIFSETQEVGTASVLSDDGELPVGTGTALSLPTFMARFLQGIVDRLQVRIRGITINLDIDVPNENSKSPPSTSTDPVTVQLQVDDVDIEGVTHDLDKDSVDEHTHQKRRHKEGKRLICLSKIQGALITEANFFSSLAPSSAICSPSAVHSDLFLERRAASKASSTRGVGFKMSESGSSDRRSAPSSSPISSRSLPRNPSNTGSMSGSAIASDSGRFDDAPEDEEEPNVSHSIRGDLSQIGDSVLQDSACSDQVTESQFLEDEGDQAPESRSYVPDPTAHTGSGSPLATPRASMHLPSPPGADAGYFDARSSGVRRESMLLSTVLPSRPRFSEGRVSQSQPSLPAETNVSVEAQSQSPTSKYLAADEFVESDDDGDSSTPMGEADLTQSQLFSHEDAESMYMSAVSHDSSSSRISGGRSQGLASPPGSPGYLQSQDEPLDNLEHARHVAPVQASSELGSSQISTLPEHLQNSSSPSTASESQHIPPAGQSASDASDRSATSSDDYSRLSKQIFSLDRIDVYIPSASPGTTPDSAEISSANSMLSSTFDGGNDASYSTSINVPGAFSTYLPRETTPSAARTERPTIEKKATEAGDSAIEVEFGRLLAQFDTSVGRLLFRLVSSLREALPRDPPAGGTGKQDPNPADMSLKFSAKELSLKFLERLEGTRGSTVAWSDAEVVDADVLLRATLTGLLVDTQSSKSITKTAITLKKFVLGYAKEPIVVFDPDLQMRASIRDLKAAEGIDVSVKIIQTAETTRYDVITLPMHVSIDLQRLDETFSWFGGLSSVLNMGSSMVSNATVTAISPTKPKPRGVRFETPIKPDDKSVVAQNKADVRIGGFILDLVGTECAIGVETSAIKIVSRDEGIGVAIQKMKLSGPHLRRSDEDPAINVEVTSTRIEYLPSPKDTDLDRLLSLITPSKAKYDQDDDILLDTLLRQRKQGAILRLTIDDLQARVGKLDELSYLPELGEEVSRLSTVAKYLPDDDRPGLLSLVMVHKFDAHVDVNNTVGTIQLSSTDIEVAQITLPALVALSVNTISVRRNASEDLLDVATDPELREPRARSPAIMARMIGDEMEPTVKVKLWNLKVEYRVSTLMVLLGLAENATPLDLSASLTASVATLTDFARSKAPMPSIPEAGVAVKPSSSSSKPMNIDVVIRDCVLGLNPMGLPSKILVVLSEAHLMAALPKGQNANASMDMSKGSLLIIDNIANLVSGNLPTRSRRYSFDGGSTQVADLCATGYVSVSYISSAKAIVQVTASEDGERSIDVELRDDLFVLESCADSTQTLIATVNGLAPPTLPSKETKYRTKVIPVHDLLASLSGDAFGTAEGDYNFEDDFGVAESSELEDFPGEEADDLDFDSYYYQKDAGVEHEAIYEDESGSSAHLSIRDTQDGVMLDSYVESQEAPTEGGALEFQEDHFGTGSILDGTAHRWNSTKNTYDRSNTHKVKKSPLKVCVRDVHIIWNLFDGYDWQHTRDTITKAVQDVESKAIEKRARNERRPTFDQDIDDEETVIGDFLFNSIYIGIPANRDPRELAAAINQELNDNATETESIATTSLSSSPSRPGSARRTKSKKLRLNRSKHHKITFELRGVSVDLVAFPPNTGETQSSVDIRVHDFEIFDHVPTSTWRKFATYMQDAGERETGSSMIHIEILNVKPIPDLAASEIVLKANVLPLRLHVDQDALDFITRFFEFKDDSSPSHNSPGDAPFLQRVEVNSVQVKLDFKPKRVDYAGLRSGHTTEFMNFLILDEADMVLRHTIIYGISGFDKLGKCLNDIWMPDIKRNQLPGILAGLAPVRSLVNVGGGFRHLVVIPMREYKKDGRIVRSISKGAAAFAKTTGTELVKLGAKVAIGVQTVLQGAEGFLGPTIESSNTTIEGDDSEEESKQISLYANQPVGVMQGLRGGYAGLQRDLVLARDAIIAVPGEVMEGGNAAGVLRAVRKHAPTVILRPAIGVAKAGGQILMGATNSLDPVNLQRADAVSPYPQVFCDTSANGH